MKKVLLATLALLTLQVGVASSAQFFDFNGQALVPTTVGNDLEMYGVIFDAAPAAETPLPLDFDNFEYTIVITGLTFDSDGFTETYSGGTIAIYEDAATAADYGNQATFTDGTAILVGTVTTLQRTIFFVSSGVGSANGNVDWTGGSRIDEIHPSDRLGWFYGGGISGGSTVEPGYDENWDHKVEPQDPIVSNEQTSFGLMKSGF